MKIVFFGSSGFSVPALKSLATKTVCVVTKLAKPKGRGYLLEDNEVKKAAGECNIPLLEIKSFKDEAIHEIEVLAPDLFVVASFGLIIPRWALEIPKIGPVNVHPSLLPKYRGPSPMQWALLNGDKVAGITLIRMSERMDAGNILYQEPAVIEDDDDIITLSDRLSTRAAQILPPFIEGIEAHGLAEGEVQREDDATYTPIVTKEMGKIDWQKSAVTIGGQIKAFASWPVAYTSLDGVMLKIFRAGIIAGIAREMAGTIEAVSKDGITVSTGKGLIQIKEVQLENRKRMTAFAFAQGYRGLTGKVLA